MKRLHAALPDNNGCIFFDVRQAAEILMMRIFITLFKSASHILSLPPGLSFWISQNEYFPFYTEHLFTPVWRMNRENHPY